MTYNQLPIELFQKLKKEIPNDVNNGFGIIPVMRVALHDDTFVDHPVFQGVRAIGTLFL
jgi:hypothetical protein